MISTSNSSPSTRAGSGADEVSPRLARSEAAVFSHQDLNPRRNIIAWKPHVFVRLRSTAPCPSQLTESIGRQPGSALKHYQGQHFRSAWLSVGTPKGLGLNGHRS